MKCAEAEMKMYIYAELDAAEQALVDAHLKNCVVCQQLMIEIDASQKSLRQKLTVETTIRPDLTLRIMNALPPRRSTFVERLLQHPKATAPRLVMAVVSLLLVAVFSLELQRDPAAAPVALQASTLWKTRLDSRAFLRATRRDSARAEAPGLIECLRACRSEARECEHCKKRFPNILTQL